MNHTSPYPAGLEPTTADSYEIDGVTLEIPQTSLVFERWAGEPILNTFGGKPLVNYEGKPVFAELAIQKLAGKGGWSSRWVETYAMKAATPYLFTGWLDGALTEQVVTPILEPEQNELLAKVAAQNNGSFYGCWDVLAWKGDRTIFLESKRTKKDSVRSTQLLWAQAGLAAGLSLDNFLIVQWDFKEFLREF